MSDLIRNVYDAFNRKDYAGVIFHFNENIRWIAADHSPLADRSPYQGLVAVREGVFSRIEQGFESLTVQADEIIEAGNKIIVLGYYHGKLKGKDQAFRAQLAHVWTHKDGKLILFQQYLDTFAVAQAVR
jgi:ketosteroid isomerase-like protein